MTVWSRVAADRLLVDVSLWSADLTALGTEMDRMAGAADLFHLDVTDGRFAPELLFFPALVAALRPHTTAPLHAHLMVTDPAPVAEAFACAGADLITVHVETGEQQAARAVKAITAAGKAAGLAVRLDTDLRAVVPLLEHVDAVVMVGTPLGTKGTPASPETARRITAMRGLLSMHAPGRDIRVLADGGIRSTTVPRLAAAGAHGVVAGSLLFGADDLQATIGWLHSMGQRR